MKKIALDKFKNLPAGLVVLESTDPADMLFPRFYVKNSQGDLRSLSLRPTEDEDSPFSLQEDVVSTIDFGDGSNPSHYVALNWDEVNQLISFYAESAGAYDRNQWIKRKAGALPEVPEGAIHVDEWLARTPMFFGDKKPLNYAHFMLNHFRHSAPWKIAHEPFMKQFKLFVTYQEKTYRVTGASSIGDIWLSSNFDDPHGYDHNGRVPLDFSKLSDWRDKPEPTEVPEPLTEGNA